MAKNGTSPWWYINASILVALILNIMPLPIQLKGIWPDWAAMGCYLFGRLQYHKEVNIGTAWIVGFLLDILLGTVLGVNALGLSIVVFAVSSNFQKLRNFTVWQQAALVGVFLVLFHLVVFWLNRFFIKRKLFRLNTSHLHLLVHYFGYGYFLFYAHIAEGLKSVNHAKNNFG